jgi:hypothetical protein
MGTIQHHAVIATTWSEGQVQRIRDWVATLPELDSLSWSCAVKDRFAFSPAVMNGYVTVTLCPDGSKEGWEDSDEGDNLRALFIQELKKADYEDGSNPWAIVEVGYGEYGAHVVWTNQEDCFK